MVHHLGSSSLATWMRSSQRVGIATLELLERLGCSVDYPFDQTCRGQPMVNTGCHKEAAATEKLFVKNFSAYDYIVCPSGSCTHQVRANPTAIERQRRNQLRIGLAAFFLEGKLRARPRAPPLPLFIFGPAGQETLGRPANELVQIDKKRISVITRLAPEFDRKTADHSGGKLGIEFRPGGQVPPVGYPCTKGAVKPQHDPG
jgi:hypothetical protein